MANSGSSVGLLSTTLTLAADDDVIVSLLNRIFKSWMPSTNSDSFGTGSTGLAGLAGVADKDLDLPVIGLVFLRRTMV